MEGRNKKKVSHGMEPGKKKVSQNAFVILLGKVCTPSLQLERTSRTPVVQTDTLCQNRKILVVKWCVSGDSDRVATTKV